MMILGRPAIGKFPAPREVDRELYNLDNSLWYFLKRLFPAPLEVDRELYACETQCDDTTFSFPVPLEVDRELYSFTL